MSSATPRPAHTVGARSHIFARVRHEAQASTTTHSCFTEILLSLLHSRELGSSAARKKDLLQDILRRLFIAPGARVERFGAQNLKTQTAMDLTNG